MTNEQERERVAEILAKQERGEKLTDKEWTILAYSPYGRAAGAPRAPQA
jgi:sulfur relay (sulfurtransferase) DsrC/TusE family protein